MSLEDPFFVVREYVLSESLPKNSSKYRFSQILSEVLNALTKCRNYFERWTDFEDDPNAGTKEELDWTTTELRNGLRSIEWDLEDLEETIGIVENNPKKFKLDETEINIRRKFIEQTKDEVKFMREKLFDSKNKERKMSFKPNNSLAGNSNAKYTRLDNSEISPHRTDGSEAAITVDDSYQLRQHQQRIVQSQDDTLDKLRSSVGNLKSISRQIGTEVDEHAV